MNLLPVSIAATAAMTTAFHTHCGSVNVVAWFRAHELRDTPRFTVLRCCHAGRMRAPITGPANQQKEHVSKVNKLVAMVEDLALCDQEALEELIRLAVNPPKSTEEPVLGAELIRVMLR
jgi:condensin complex subunit 1